jgi:hypothetical protein
MAKHLDPGLYDDIPHDVYHADPCGRPSLSAHTAMVLVKRSAGHAARIHPRLGGEVKKRTDSMDTGSLLHDFVIGGGGAFVEVEADAWNTKDAKERRKNANEEGKIAVLSKKMVILREAAKETLPALPFDVADARREVTAIWESGGTPCRARIDLLFPDLWIWDLKFTEDAVLASADRNIAERGSHIQAASNIEAIETRIPEAAGRVRFGLCFIEWENPEIGIVRREIRGQLLDVGKRKWDRAKRIWGECLAANRWPGYSTEITEALCPAWVAAEEMEQQIASNSGSEPF